MLINYNAYGEKPGDRLFEPADLASRMASTASALDFCWEAAIVAPLAAQFDADRERFQELRPLVESPGANAFLGMDALTTSAVYGTEIDAADLQPIALGGYDAWTVKLSDLWVAGAGATLHVTGLPF